MGGDTLAEMCFIYPSKQRRMLNYHMIHKITAKFLNFKVESLSLFFERTYMSFGVQPKDKEQIPDIPKKK